MTLNLKCVESFVISAQTLNFSETAEQRATVQSAISSQIVRLERQLGQVLFDRKRGGQMKLTPEGRVFLPQALRLLAIADEAVNAVRHRDKRPKIRLGTTSTLAASVVPNALRAFRKRHHNIRFEISCDRSSELMAGFERGEYDVIMSVDQGNANGRRFVHDVPLGWLASEDFDAQEHTSLPLVFLADGQDLRRFAITALDRVGKPHHIAHVSSDPAGVRAIVSAGLAVTVSPRFETPKPLCIPKHSDEFPNPGRLAFSCYAAQLANIPEVIELSKFFEDRLTDKMT